MAGKRRLQVMSMTPAAAERVKSLVSRASEPALALRLGVRNGGCAGMAYTMELTPEILPGDEVVEDLGATVVVDPKAVLFLLGTQLDVEAGKLSSGFVFRNPNQTSACGCGESVAIEPASPQALAAAV